MNTIWHDADNWRDTGGNHGVPGAGDDAMVLSTNAAVSLHASTQVQSFSFIRGASLIIDNGSSLSWTGELSNDGAITLATGSSLVPFDGAKLDCSFSIYGPGTLSVFAGRTVTVNTPGTQSNLIAPTSIQGTLIVTQDAFFRDGVTIATSGLLRVEGTAPFGAQAAIIGPGGLTVDGTIELTSTDADKSAFLTLTSGAVATVSVSGKIESRAGAGGFRGIPMYESTQLVNHGTILAVENDLSIYRLPVNPLFINTGNITVGAGRELELSCETQLGGSLNGPGRLRLSGAVPVALINNLTLSNSTIPQIVMDYGYLTGPGTLTVAPGQTASITCTNNGGVIDAPLNVLGTLVVAGRCIASDAVQVAAGGKLQLLGGGSALFYTILTVDGGSLNVAGLLEMTSLTDNDATYLDVVNGNATIAVGGRLSTLGSNNSSTLRSVSVRGTTGTGAFTNNGTIQIDANTDIRAESNGTFVNTGTISLGQDRQLAAVGSVINGGILTGAGTVTGSVAGPTEIRPGVNGPGALGISGDVTTNGPVVIELNGLTTVSQYDLVYHYNGTLACPLAVRTNFAAPIGTVFLIVDRSVLATGTFANFSEGDVVPANDGQTFRISYTGGDGNDVTLTRVPRVSDAVVNDGMVQRSQVSSLQVAFDAEVTFAGSVSSAFALTRTGGGAVDFSATASLINGLTVVTFENFTGIETQFGSLRDGRYTLTALASQISSNGELLNNGTNFTFGDAQGLFRYYGDIDGNRQVDNVDFFQFRAALGSMASSPNYRAVIDFSGDGQVDNTDYFQFRLRLGQGPP